MGNELVGTPKDLAVYMGNMKEQIERGLPAHIPFGQAENFALIALNGAPALQQCTRESFMKAFVESLMIGLIPNTPLNHAALVPYKGKVKLLPMYEGLAELLYRSGKVSLIEAHVVYTDDEWEYEAGLTPILRHVPSLESENRQPDNMVYVYSLIRVTGSEAWPKIEVMTKKEVDLIRARSASGQSQQSPWVSDYVPMALKTVLKRNMKALPKSSEKDYGLAKAVMLDNQFETGKNQNFDLKLEGEGDEPGKSNSEPTA